MYYPERHRAGEVPTVLRLMMDCYEEPGVLDMPSTDDPHWVIVMWAGVVRRCVDHPRRIKVDRPSPGWHRP